MRHKTSFANYDAVNILVQANDLRLYSTYSGLTRRLVFGSL